MFTVQSSLALSSMSKNVIQVASAPS